MQEPIRFLKPVPILSPGPKLLSSNIKKFLLQVGDHPLRIVSFVWFTDINSSLRHHAISTLLQTFRPVDHPESWVSTDKGVSIFGVIDQHFCWIVLQTNLDPSSWDKNSLVLGSLFSLSESVTLGGYSTFHTNYLELFAPFVDCLDDKPFGKLIVAIEAWGSPTSYEYGVEGGRRFLDDQETSQGWRRVRVGTERELWAAMNNSFEQIECHLLPHVGPKSQDFVKTLVHSVLGGVGGRTRREFCVVLENIVGAAFSGSFWPIYEKVKKQLLIEKMEEEVLLNVNLGVAVVDLEQQFREKLVGVDLLDKAEQDKRLRAFKRKIDHFLKERVRVSNVEKVDDVEKLGPVPPPPSPPPPPPPPPTQPTSSPATNDGTPSNSNPKASSPATSDTHSALMEEIKKGFQLRKSRSTDSKRNSTDGLREALSIIANAMAHSDVEDEEEETWDE